MRAIIIFLATGAYSGYSPFAPGTAGSVVGILVLWFGFAPLWSHSPPLAVLLWGLAFIAGCWICGRADEIFGGHDNNKIVLDEVLGMVLTMVGNPMAPLWILGGFFLFRLFDVLKPFPAGWIDRNVGGGTGVMLDDIAAAIYANIVLQIFARVL